MPYFQIRALILVVLLSATARANASESLALATDDYLADANRMSLGTTAAAAGGGVKGWLSLRLLAWYPALSGTGNDEGGGDYDVRADFGLDDNELALVPQITIDWWIFGFRTDYFGTDFEGEGTIESDFTFGGVTLVRGERVSTEARITAYRSLGMISFLNNDTVRIAAIIGFNYYTYEATVTGETGGTATISGSLPFPVVGLFVQVRVSDFLFELEASGFYVDYGDVNATTIDATLSAA